MTVKTATPESKRPLSPHLQIYRPQLTSVLSITHRATGIALAIGTIFLVGWLWSAAYNSNCFNSINTFFTSILGRIMLVGWSFAFYFHLCNGIRHLFWDIGKGFEIPHAYRSGYAVVIVTIVLTGLTWIAVLSQAGSQ